MGKYKSKIVVVPKNQKCQCPIHNDKAILDGLWYKNKMSKWYCPSCVKELLEKKLKNGKKSRVQVRV